MNENITSAAYYRQIENQKDLQRHTFIRSIQSWLPFFLLFGLVYCTTTSFPFIAWCNMLVLVSIFYRDYWPTSFKLLLLTELCLLFFAWFLNVKTKYQFSWCYDPFCSKPSQDYYISVLCTSINYSYLGYVWKNLVKHTQ